jgi:hypothetical protein
VIWVALAEAAALAAVVLTGAGLLRSQQRSYARERDLILNQLLHLAGRTWQPPPAEPPFENAADDVDAAYPELMADWET